MKGFRIGICGLVLAGTAAPADAAKPEFARPAYAGAYEPQGTDERGLWMEFDEGERALRDAPAMVRDAKLNAYVRGVLCRTVGEDRCAAARIYIVQDSIFNASMAPNGLMLVHTGLLARLHSEAELAIVLGHEFSHFEQRHSLRQFRRQRSASDMLAWISLAGVAANTNTAALQTVVVGSFFGYTRDQETEADLLAVNFVRASPYRLRGSDVWQRATEEEDALRADRGLRKVKRVYPGLADTHPTNAQRFAYLKKAELEVGDRGDEGAEAFRLATASIMPGVLAALVKGNEFGAADYVIHSRGDALGWDGPLLFARGELFRLRANPRDLVTARGYFEQAVAKPDAPPESWRGLGLAAMRLGDSEAGRGALKEYLKRLPNAVDAASINLLVEN